MSHKGSMLFLPFFCPLMQCDWEIYRLLLHSFTTCFIHSHTNICSSCLIYSCTNTCSSCLIHSHTNIHFLSHTPSFKHSSSVSYTLIPAFIHILSHTNSHSLLISFKHPFTSCLYKYSFTISYILSLLSHTYRLPHSFLQILINTRMH